MNLRIGNNHHGSTYTKGGAGRLVSLTIVLLTLISFQMMFSISTDANLKIVTNADATSVPDFNFAAVGDWGCRDITKKTVDNIVSESTELVLGLGDYSYDKTDDCWFETISQIDDQMKIAIGNHDNDYPGKLEGYMSHYQLERQFYSFNYQNVHFTVMSTETAYDETSEQYKFVKEDLATAASNPDIGWIVVAFHRPMYISSEDDPGHSPLSHLRDTYHELFDQYHVDLVLQAHKHAYERTMPIKYNSSHPESPIVTDKTSTSSYNDPEGAVFATVGTGGQSLHVFLAKSPFSVIQFSTYGFLNIDMINGGSTMRATFYGNDDKIRDQFTIVKSPLANNNPPIARFTADQTIIDEFQTTNLDASESFDPDGDSLTYAFRQIAGTPGIILIDAESRSKAVFEAPSVSENETAIVELTVDDGKGGVRTATIDFLVMDRGNNPVRCNCVIFRIDDITDNSYSEIKRTVMDQFIAKHQDLALAIVMNHFGNDQNLVDKVVEGQKMGLFELTIHGWDHVRFPDYSMEQQKTWLDSSNLKLKDMFGTTSQVFSPPYAIANIDTLIAMSELGFKVLSIQNSTEFFPQFILDGSVQHDGYGIYHIPYSAKFKDYGSEGGVGIKVPVDNVLRDIDTGIKNYGYAVVVMHPQDFAIMVDGKPTRKVDQSQIDDLNYIIDMVLAKGRATTTYSKLLGIVTPAYVDGIDPSIIAPPDIGASQTGNLTTVSLGTPIVRDNSDHSPTITNDAPKDGFPLGTTIVTWTATDASGNRATTTQYVTIGQEPDTTLPLISITLPRPSTKITGPATGLLINVTGTATDFESGIKFVQLKAGSQPFQKTTPKSPNDWSMWQKTVNIQEQGTVYLQAKATDYFGNVRWSSRIPINVAFESSPKPSGSDNEQPSNDIDGILGDRVDLLMMIIIPVVVIPTLAIYIVWRQRAQKRKKDLIPE